MASAETQLTPMMTQYRRIKGELPKDALLLFRLGDFYEMFFEDALASAHIFSPGTHFDERMLVAERNNFLAAVCPRGKIFGLALVDLTTGDFLTTELENESALLTELERLRPAEIIFPTEAIALRDLLHGRTAPLTPSLSPSNGERVAKPGEGSVSSKSNFGWIVSGYDDWTFAPETAVFTVREHFKVASLDGFGLKDRSAAIGTMGGALHCLTQHLRRDAKNFTRISFCQRSVLLADVLTLT